MTLVYQQPGLAIVHTKPIQVVNGPTWGYPCLAVWLMFGDRAHTCRVHDSLP